MPLDTGTRHPPAGYTRSSMPTERISSSSWESISDKLRDALNAGTYGKWFGSASALEETDEVLVVGVPNEFTKSWIESHFGSLLGAAAAEHDLVVELRVAVAEAVAEVASAPDAAPRRASQSAGGSGRAGGRPDGLQAQPPVHLRPVCDRPVQPFCARCGAGSGRVARPGLQPVVHPRIDRPGENSPAPGGRSVRRPATLGPECAICHNRDADERVCRRFAGKNRCRVQTAV